MTFGELSEILLAWPQVEQSTSYGTAAFKVRGKLLTRLKEDGDSLVVKGVPQEERDMLCQSAPDIFYFTDHYRDYPIVLLRLSHTDRTTVTALLRRTYLELLPKQLKQSIDLDRLS